MGRLLERVLSLLFTSLTTTPIRLKGHDTPLSTPKHTMPTRWARHSSLLWSWESSGVSVPWMGVGEERARATRGQASIVFTLLVSGFLCELSRPARKRNRALLKTTNNPALSGGRTPRQPTGQPPPRESVGLVAAV